MKLTTLNIKDIKPYANNPRVNDAAAKSVEESIRQCSYINPIIVDENNKVLAGHTRLKALKRLGKKECQVLIAEGLTEEQKKKFRILDNKTGEEAQWSKDLLEIELEDLDFDGYDFGFDELLTELSKNPIETSEREEQGELEQDDEGYYGDERERTFNSVNLNDVDLTRVAGRFQMPIIKAETHIPKDIISFNYVLSTDEFDKGVHFYIDDYQFERIWNSPHSYMERLKMFDCCLTPDFSLYTEMPIAMQIWNIYRSRMIGQIMQNYGITVIPTLSWCRKESFKFCFDGLEPGGVYSVSTIGVKQDAEAGGLWTAGMDEAMRRLSPRGMIIYGGDIGYKFDCETVYINNHNAERLGTDSNDRKTL